MPQLLPFYFINMISYSFLLFVVILYILSTYILPTYVLLFNTRMALTKLPPLLFLPILFGITLFITPIGGLEFGESEGLLSVFVPVAIYRNTRMADKSKIFSDLINKGGIYMWRHNESGKTYIGSAIDLNTRLKNYYSLSCLKEWDNYISRALLQHTHSAFSLYILDYIDVNGLSKKEARNLVLLREQYYLDYIFSENKPNTYNILKVAGSSLGFVHTEETKAFISLLHTGKIVSKETRLKLSQAKIAENNPMYGKTGENSTRGMLGKTHTTHTILKMSQAKIGINHPRAMLGKTHSAETKAKISSTKGSHVYIYDLEGTLINTFPSARKAAIFYDSNSNTILNYARNGNIFKDKWILSLSLITKD